MFRPVDTRKVRTGWEDEGGREGKETNLSIYNTALFINFGLIVIIYAISSEKDFIFIRRYGSLVGKAVSWVSCSSSCTSIDWMDVRIPSASALHLYCSCRPFESYSRMSYCKDY